MSSDPVLDERPCEPATRAAVVPIFACPGAREVEVQHLVFPHGGGFTEMAPCPGRDICLWYAAHDLGQGEAINELPPETVVPADFHTAPFSCKRFHEFQNRWHTERPAPTRRRWPAATLVGLIELAGVLAFIDFSDALML